MAGEVYDLNDWETGNYLQWAGGAIEAGTPSSQCTVGTSSPSPVAGTYRGKVTVSGSQGGNYSAGTSRCLCRETLNNSNQDVLRGERRGDTYFYSFADYFPTGTLVESGVLHWELHQHNGDFQSLSPVSLVAPLALLWRNGDWQFRYHTGKWNPNNGGQFGPDGIVNNNLGVATVDRDAWLKWVIEVYFHEVGRIRVYMKRPGDSDLVLRFEKLNYPTIMWINDPTEDHQYYRTEGVYRASQNASESARFMDQNGRHATLADARAALGLSSGSVTVGPYTDNADDNSLGPRFITSTSVWTATETGSQWQVGGSGATGSAEFRTNDLTYDHTSQEIFIEVPDAGNQSVSQLITFLGLRKDASNELELQIQGNQLKAFKKVAGVSSNPGTPLGYSLGVVRFLRLRNVSGVMYWDYSPDGNAWSTLYSENNPFTLTAVQHYWGARATSPSATVGTPKFDNVAFAAASSGVGAPPPDQTDFPVLNDGQDLYVRKEAAAYASVAAASAVLFGAASTIYVARGYNGVDTYNVDVSALEFDTQGAPDAKNIQTAALEFVSTIVGSADARNLVGEYYAGAMDATAWADSFAGTACFSAVALSTINPNSTVSIPLINLSNISKTGVTRIRMGVSGGSPSGANYLGINAIGGAQPVPRLKLTYIDPQTGGPVTQYFYATSANGFCGGSLKTANLKTIAGGTRNAALVGS